jgi:hypothetical protein
LRNRTAVAAAALKGRVTAENGNSNGSKRKKLVSSARGSAERRATEDYNTNNNVVIGKGYGLQSTAYSPLTTTLGISEAIEAQGQQPFTLGVNLGGRQTQANQYGAGLLNTASQNAALTRQAANQYSPTAAAISGAVNSPSLQNWLNNQINPSYTQTTSNTGLMYDQSGMNPQAATYNSYNPNWYGGTGGMGD